MSNSSVCRSKIFGESDLLRKSKFRPRNPLISLKTAKEIFGIT
jgi:hypothetical protein